MDNILKSLFLAFVIIIAACSPTQTPPAQPQQNAPQAIHAPAAPQAAPAPQAPAAPQNAQATALDAKQLTQAGLKIPSNQSAWSALPPQPGQQVLGKTVKGGPGSDTDWTTTILVLFRDANGKWEVMTQKRAIPPVGAIETAGGHLTGGQSWRDGARSELQQEAGVHVGNNDLIYQRGGTPRLSSTGKLIGHVNFFVVFSGSKPSTSVTTHEVDANYGHQWLQIGTLYNQVKAEQNALGFSHGVYYSSFRQQLISFVDDVLQGKF